MQTATRPWKTIYRGTLETWIKKNHPGMGYTIREKYGILDGTDVSYGGIAVDRNGNTVAVEHVSSDCTVCLVYVLE